MLIIIQIKQHLIAILQWVCSNPVVAYLLLIKIARSAQDAIDAKPKDLKPPLGSFIYYLTAIGQDLGWGNRPQSITGGKQ